MAPLPYVVFLGPPATGKGTQAKRLADQAGFIHLATGDLLRKAVADGSELGNVAGPIMKAGGLVPDQLVLRIFEEWVDSTSRSTPRGVILDGFPRTIAQAEVLDRILDKAGARVVRVVLISCPDQELIQRISTRRSCPQCGAVYNLSAKPPRIPDQCDQCGHRGLFQRPDDLPETIKTRLAAYWQQTAPLVDYYRQKGLMVEIGGGSQIDAVARKIHDALRDLLAPRT